MKKKSYQARLDIMAAALNIQGTAGPYCNCRSQDAKDNMQLIFGKEEIQFPDCNLPVCNPRPSNLIKEPEPGSQERILEIMFPDGIQERPGQIAAELWNDAKEPKDIIELGQIPEPEPEPESSGDPLQDMVVKRLLNRQELADKLLVQVPESTQDD